MSVKRKWLYLRLSVIVALAALVLWWAWPREPRFRPLDPVPGSAGTGKLYRHGNHVVLELSGMPEELGAQHGTLLPQAIRKLISQYVEQQACESNPELRRKLLRRVKKMKPALPEWYLAELSSCAQAAGVDEDLLLLAQCEGDIRSLGSRNGGGRPEGACSAYVILNHPQNGQMQIGRNFDYSGGDFIYNCALVTRTRPAQGYAFYAIGWSGILGGWTLINEKKLTIANHLGGGSKTNPRGIPTLVLTRILAQKAATVDEAIELIKKLPRMRGQIIWLAQPADPSIKRPARAVAVEYDAERVHVREAQNGVLIVTNRNLVFGRKDGRPVNLPGDDGPYAKLMRAARSPGRFATGRIICQTGRLNTLHSVELFPEQNVFYLAHGRFAACEGTFVRYLLRFE